MASLTLDISRTLARAGRWPPTGIDRVERAYIDHLLTQDDPQFTFRTRLGAGALGASGVHRVLDLIAKRPARPRTRAALLAHRLSRRVDLTNRVMLEVGHGDHAPPEAGARIVMIHDLIPLTHPEYARPGGAEAASRRLAAAATADVILTNSEATREEVILHLGTTAPPVHALPLGVEPLTPAPHTVTPDTPYFVMLGTIEPRKNHLGMLQIWRRFSDEQRSAPTLHIIGRRGWENEQILDMLDRSPMRGRLVYEHAQMNDGDAAAFLAGATALLAPSFAEGFGLPVAEALSLGAPVIAADLPAFREVGGDAATYIDPLDLAGWRDAILAQTDKGARPPAWRAPRWADHFATLDRIIDDMARP